MHMGKLSEKKHTHRDSTGSVLLSNAQWGRAQGTDGGGIPEASPRRIMSSRFKLHHIRQTSRTTTQKTVLTLVVPDRTVELRACIT